MESRSIFLSLSPLDHRYFLANRDTFEKLSGFLSEEAGIAYSLKAEAALLKTHVDFFFDSSDKKKSDVDRAASGITAEEVYAEEERTKHNIRALVNVLQRRVPEGLRPFVHLGATSVDILDTALSMRLKGAVKGVLLPLLIEVEKELCRIAREHAGVPQIGRTHGQHAVPITVGFAFAEYVSRLGKSIREIQIRADGLRGKLAGAVGAYNATSLITGTPEMFEKTYLDYCGLSPSDHSTQIVEPEYTLRLLLEINTAFGIMANLADDLRNLQRTEVGEAAEYFSADQVGSSTMPQKRNPWNSEHVKSLWKVYAPRVVTFYMDQLSDHQRDLTNSASSRFIAEFIAGTCAAAGRLRSVLEGLHIDREACMKNLGLQGGMVLAEGIYVLLALSGEEQGHEIVRRISSQVRESGVSFKQAVINSTGVWEKISPIIEKNYGIRAEDLFDEPHRYRGISETKALSLSQRFTDLMMKIEEEIS
jgi:adenylosuccinate lyase